MIYTKEYEAPPYSRREIWRYSGVTQEGPEEAALLAECLAAVEGKLSYRACRRELPVSVTGDRVELGFMQMHSASAARRLAGCGHVVVFAATIGAELDRLVARYSAVSPAKALMLDTIGTERIEALCDAVCADLAREYKKRGLVTRERFSPGYGDLALSVQRDVFDALDCARRIGLSLGGELLMSPLKSVTAFVGVAYEDH